MHTKRTQLLPRLELITSPVIQGVPDLAWAPLSYSLRWVLRPIKSLLLCVEKFARNLCRGSFQTTTRQIEALPLFFSQSSKKWASLHYLLPARISPMLYLESTSLPSPRRREGSSRRSFTLFVLFFFFFVFVFLSRIFDIMKMGEGRCWKYEKNGGKMQFARPLERDSPFRPERFRALHGKKRRIYTPFKKALRPSARA